MYISFFLIKIKKHLEIQIMQKVDTFLKSNQNMLK